MLYNNQAEIRAGSVYRRKVDIQKRMQLLDQRISAVMGNAHQENEEPRSTAVQESHFALPRKYAVSDAASVISSVEPSRLDDKTDRNQIRAIYDMLQLTLHNQHAIQKELKELRQEIRVSVSRDREHSTSVGTNKHHESLFEHEHPGQRVIFGSLETFNNTLRMPPAVKGAARPVSMQNETPKQLMGKLFGSSQEKRVAPGKENNADDVIEVSAIFNGTGESKNKHIKQAYREHDRHLAESALDNMSVIDQVEQVQNPSNMRRRLREKIESRLQSSHANANTDHQSNRHQETLLCNTFELQTRLREDLLQRIQTMQDSKRYK